MVLTGAHPLYSHFMGWQCRIRQHSVRRLQGRPSVGMQPSLQCGENHYRAVNVLIIKSQPRKLITEFKFMVQKTADPRIRYDNAIKFLSEYYYQRPNEFDQELTAVFSLNSEIVDQLADNRQCNLTFEQGTQQFQLYCDTRLISAEDDKYQVTYWHNYLFNPHLPGKVAVIGFQPDWECSRASSLPHAV